jgi:glycine cleavage system T protein (aminomethyltransferase)
MPIGTPFHPRTSALCESMAWRDWAGYFAVSAYEATHEREYNAIRNAAALIDVSPLFKYRVSGPDATRLVDRVVTRNVPKMAVGQVSYTHWCDGEGKVIDDGTVSRLAPEHYRWTAAEPNLRWIRQNAGGLEVEVEDVSDQVAALALQGPTSREILKGCVEGDIAALRYFRVMPATIRGIPVDISRTGYTGDLGYEIWVASDQALPLWDALIEAGQGYDITPTGMLALDVARIEAGLILLDVDYTSSKRALIPSQKYSPYEIGLGRLVSQKKGPHVGQAALRLEAERGPSRELVGLDVSWEDVERLHEEAGLAPQVPSTASRASVPVYREGAQVGRASSTTWSPTLKKMIALATVARDAARPGTTLQMEMTVDHRRREVGVRVVTLPFFDPPRKRA